MKALLAFATAFGIASYATPSRSESLDKVIAVLAAEQMPAGFGIAEIHPPASMANLDVVADAVSLAWTSTPHAGRMSVRVQVRGEHNSIKRGWVQLSIAALAPVAVATRTLPIGTIIAATDIRSEMRASDPARAAAPVVVIGARTTTEIAVGNAITADAVAIVPPIATGTVVTVRIVGSGFSVRTEGTLARVTGRGLVRGTLIDANTLELSGTGASQ